MVLPSFHSYFDIGFAHMVPVRFCGASAQQTVSCLFAALRLAVKEGDPERGCFLAGQAACAVTREQPAAEIVREVAEEAEKCLKGAAPWAE